jgi:hypothetical protein
MSDLGLGPPLIFVQGGGEEPALNRGLAAEDPISDSAPTDFRTGAGKGPLLLHGVASPLYSIKSLRSLLPGTHGFRGEGRAR